MPFKYLQVAREELQKLLDAGLIYPGYSNWSSPVICIVKKDSSTDKLRVKLAVDYRALNAVTTVDTGQLGDQSEILAGFGGNQKYVGLADAAAGFYQLRLDPKDAHKSCFCVPASMGGTTFIWKVAPYGLARNPAAYSRAMMYVMRGLSRIPLANGTSVGGTGTWIDDICMHADSFDGFCDLFDKVLGRLVSAGMTLKASKCHLLHEKLYILGYILTPDGLRMDPAKVDALEKVSCPRTVPEVRTFLGACQFYRSFCEHLATLAQPLFELLKKDPKIKSDDPSILQSFNAVMAELRSDRVLALPDLHDPYAEYVICTDASDFAAGAVLMQWQSDVSPGQGPPEGEKPRGGGPGKGDPITNSWRHKAGWKLTGRIGSIKNVEVQLGGDIYHVLLERRRPGRAGQALTVGPGHVAGQRTRPD